MKFTIIIEKWDTIVYTIYNCVQTLLYYIKFISIKKKISKNKEIIKYDGQRCFVVLNGPSLMENDLSYLENEYVFCTNFMYKSKDIVKTIKPNFYCWTDSKIFFQEGCDILLNDLYKTCGNIPYFFSYNYLKKYDEIQKNIFLTYNKFIPTKNNINCSINGRFCSYNSVGFYAIAIAMALGFKEINILGMDFEPGGFKHVEEHGKYTNTTLMKDDKNSVCTEYKQYSQAQFESYYILNQAKKRNIKIYNLNRNSYIRAFEFRNFEDIFYEK